MASKNQEWFSMLFGGKKPQDGGELQAQSVNSPAIEATMRMNKVPLLNQYCTNLPSNNYMATSLISSTKALIRALSDADGKSVLIITERENQLMININNVAGSLRGKENPHFEIPYKLKNKRIVDITSIKPIGKKITEMIELLEKLLEEAATVEDVIIVVPTLGGEYENRKDDPWLNLLKVKLKQGLIQCICQVKPEIYRNMIEKDRSWRHLIHIMWI